MIASQARTWIQEQCRSENNALSPAFFDQHVLPVAGYGLRLARLLGADSGIVEIAAYLHDISAVQDIASIAEHHRLSAEVAGGLLAEWGCPAGSIERVKQCILTHSAPLKIGEGSLEEVCLSNADAMAQIARIPYWLFFAFTVRKLGFCEGEEWLRGRVEKNWNALIEPARGMIEAEYALAGEYLK